MQNTSTNLTGRAKIERIVTAQVWTKEIEPALQKALGPNVKKSRARVGEWIVEAAGDDPHIHHFFSLNWHSGDSGSPDIRSWFLAFCKDNSVLKTLLGIHSDADLKKHRDQVLESLRDPKFRVLVKDERFLNLENEPENVQLETALAMPAFIYCPELLNSLCLNSTYYGQFKSKAVLGPLEELLTTRAVVNENGSIQNLNEVWMSMHAGCAEFVTKTREKKGVVIVGPTGTSKSTHAYGLAAAKEENRMHSDDWLFMNAGSGNVMAAEKSFYMRTPMVQFYPELAQVFLNHPLENVPLDPNDLMASLCRTPAARAMVLRENLLGVNKLSRSVYATDLFFVKRDYNDPVLIRKISVDEMLDLLISENNVWQYRGAENAVFDQRTTEFYYNPYLCRVEIDPLTKQTGELDRLRLQAWRQLAGRNGLRLFVMNARLPVVKMQECLREFLETDGKEPLL